MSESEKAIVIRPIIPADNSLLAAIIRNGIEALNLPLEGTAHTDPTTDHLFELFQTSGSAYYVLEIDHEVMGGCGIYPSNGLPAGCAELVRFFLKPEARGNGYGKMLMKISEKEARMHGYKQLYLESFPDMQAAVHLYEKYGYKRLSQPLGNTGHFSCNVWMLKEF